MIIVKLWGGMCNQMFQYAFGYALARKHNDDLAFDIDFYKNQPGHVGKRKVIGSDDFALSKLIFAERPAVVKPFERKIAMSKLKESLSTLGMDFIGEMLERRDVNEFSAIDNVLTDYSTIELAQKLGMIDRLYEASTGL